MAMASVTSALAAAHSPSREHHSKTQRWRRRTVASRVVSVGAQGSEGDEPCDSSASGKAASLSRRGALSGLAATVGASTGAAAFAEPLNADNPRAYFQRFPTLFAPFYGDDTRATILKEIFVPSTSVLDDAGEATVVAAPGAPGAVWALEQNLAIGPLETPLRCVVIKLASGALWVHAPLAPTPEFFALVVGPHSYSSPRHRLPCNSIHEGSKRAI